MWRVPIEDLLAAGLSGSDPARVEQVSQVSEQVQPAHEQATVTLREKVTELERALAVEQARNEGLQRAAAAAEQNARDLRQALRMLEVSRPEQATTEHMNMVNEQVLNSPAEQLTNRQPTTLEQPAGPMPRTGWLSRFKRLKTQP